MSEDFILGWSFFIPQYNEADEIIEEPIDIALEVGPGVSPFGDILWCPGVNPEETF